VPNLKRNLRGSYSAWTASQRARLVVGPTYEFPRLKDCREEFVHLVQQQFSWDEKEDWTHTPAPDLDEEEI
jgi:hypothetical protein